jgi:hypothetical protein
MRGRYRWPKRGMRGTYVPGPQASRMYFPSAFGGIISGGISSSNPVPPCGNRTKRFVIGVARWDPGKNDRAPFSGVHFSSANQNPRADGGSVYCVKIRNQNVAMSSEHLRTAIRSPKKSCGGFSACSYPIIRFYFSVHMDTYESLCSGTIVKRSAA